MATPIQELFAGGLVTAQDPAMLESGQLTLAENGIYMPDDPTIVRIPGRRQVLSSPGGAIQSLVACRFDDGSHWLVAQANGHWYLTSAETYKRPSDNTTGWDTLRTVSGTGPIEATQYNNRWYLSNGTDAPVTLLPNATIRQMGMLPTGANTTLQATVTSGTFSQSATGYYEYWYTEMMQTFASADGGVAATGTATGTPFVLEGTFIGTPSTVKITGASTQNVQIALPLSLANPNATHYRVYRGGPKVFQDDKVFPVGVKVGSDVPVASTKGTFDSSPNSMTATATSYTVTAGVACNATAFLANTYTNILSGVGSATATARTSVTVNALDFTNVRDPIAGIQVSVVASATAAPPLAMFNDLFVQIYSINGLGGPGDGSSHWPGDPATNYTNSKGIDVTPDKGTAYSAGGLGDFWGQTDKDGVNTTLTALQDFNSALRMIVSWNPYLLQIKQVTITVWYAGSAKDDVPFNAILVETSASDNTLVSVGAAGQPYKYDTATIFNGMHVTNDKARPRHVVFSQGGFPEYFPSPYYCKIEVPDHNSLTYLDVINGRCVAGFDGALVRINYLPTEADADFGQARERVWDYISQVRGIVNNRAATQYTDPETGLQMLAYVSTHGLYATDGYRSVKLSKSLDWTQLFPSSSNVFTDVLGLYHDMSTSTLWLVTTTNAYIYHYVTKQWTGPCRLYNRPSGSPVNVAAARWIRKANGRVVSLLGYADGTVWQQDSYDYADEVAGLITTAIPNIDGAVLKVATRDLYLAEMGQEVKVDGLFLYGEGAAYGTPFHCSVTTSQLYANGPTVTSTDTLPATGAGLAALPLAHLNADGFRFLFTASTGARGGLSKLVLLAGSHGESTIRA